MSPAEISQWAWLYANRAFVSVWWFFKQALNASGMTPIYVVVVLFCIAFRLLAAPLVGAGLAVGADVYTAGKLSRYGKDRGAYSGNHTGGLTVYRGNNKPTVRR